MVVLKFQSDSKDHLTYQLFAASMSKRIKKKRFRSKIIIPILYMLLGILFIFSGSIVLAIAFILVAILWFLFYPKFERNRYLKHYQSFVTENFKDQGLSKIELNEETIHIEEELGESKIHVKKISEINEIENYLFIMLGPGKGLIIPTNKIENLSDLTKWITDTSEKYGIKKNYYPDWRWK